MLCVPHDTVMITIPPVNQYNRVIGMNMSTRQSIVVAARMSNDLFVGLTRDPDSYTANTMYEIIIGGYFNQRSWIR